MPLVEELFHRWLFVVYGRVVGHGTLGVMQVKLTVFCLAHFNIVQVREGNQGASAHAACNDDFADFTDDVVYIECREVSALACEHPLARKVKEALQGLGAGGSAAHYFKSASARANMRVVKCYVLSRGPGVHAVSKRVAPALFTVANDKVRQFFPGLAFDQWKRLNRLSFNRKSDPRAAHRNIHNLREVLPTCRSNKRAVIDTHIARARWYASTPQKPHRAHRLHFEHVPSNFLILGFFELTAQIFAHKVDIAEYRFRPGFAAVFLIKPPRVGAVENKFGELIGKVLLALMYERLNLL